MIDLLHEAKTGHFYIDFSLQSFDVYVNGVLAAEPAWRASALLGRRLRPAPPALDPRPSPISATRVGLPRGLRSPPSSPHREYAPGALTGASPL